MISPGIETTAFTLFCADCRKAWLYSPNLWAIAPSSRQSAGTPNTLSLRRGAELTNYGSHLVLICS